mmetsp:Transcript_10766/g.15757  ORF Transcript_10766/g.15757 Transcript_10766/m.15757 type:complete len:109 (+) Transcript_10766:46-372(+)
MSQRNANFNKLFEAEKTASNIVQAAKKERVVKIKKAQEDAENEVVTYQQTKEEDFQTFKKEYLGESTDQETEINTKREKSLEFVNKMADENEQKVIDYLFEKCCEVAV